MSDLSSSPCACSPISENCRSLTPFWGRIEALWLMLPALCVTIFALCQSLAPNDLWYHVRAGQFISQMGLVPRENLMSWMVPLDAPYHYQSWVAEWVLFQLLDKGGLSALQIFRAGALCLGFLLVAAALWRFATRSFAGHDLKKSARVIALWSIVALLILSNNVDLRPQTFSFVLFCGWIFAVCEVEATKIAQRRWFWAAFLVLLTALWANTHGAFVLSLLGLGCFALARGLRGENLWRFYSVVLALCLVSVCLNPRGAHIYSYVLQLSTNPIGQKYIEEWRSPDLSHWNNWFFFLLPAILAALHFKVARSALASQFWRYALPWTLFFAVIYLMALRDVRSVIWSALVAAILLTLSSLAVFSSPQSLSESNSAIPRGVQRLNAAILILLAFSPLAFFPQIKTIWPWPDEFRAEFAPTPDRLFPRDPNLLLDRSTPVEIIEFWAQSPANRPKQRVFTEMIAGSYMTWASHPWVLPSSDPRIELFPVEFWEEYVRLSKGAADATTTLARWNCEQALVDTKTQTALIKRLSQHGWRQLARAGDFLLLSRTLRDANGNKNER